MKWDVAHEQGLCFSLAYIGVLIMLIVWAISNWIRYIAVTAIAFERYSYPYPCCY